MTVSTAFAPSRVARGVAILPQYKPQGAAGTRYLPVSIALIAQGGESTTYAATKRRVFTAYEGGSVYGFDSPIYQALESLLPPSGDGVGDIPVDIYPIASPTAGTPAAAVGTITPTVSGGAVATPQDYYILVNNRRSLKIRTAVGDDAAAFIAAGIAAVNGVLGMPGTASDGTTNVTFTAGWNGASGDNIHLAVESPDDAEVTFVIVQPTGGAGTISITEPLAAIGNVWETHVINGNDYTDSDFLDEYAAYNEGRWDPEVRKPLRVYTGTNEATLATVTAVTDARKTDRTNVILTNPGSNDLPIVIAADQVRRIAPLANTDPAHDYCARKCPRLTAAADSSQWTSAQRQAAVVAGCSTIEVVDGVVQISDVVTCYHPTGEEPPAYRKDVNIWKISTMIYNTGLIFGSSDWAGAPLVPDAQAVKTPSAKKPKMALGALYALYDAAGSDGIISDPDYAKTNSSADIDGSNPDRLNVVEVFKLGGNSNVISIDMNFGFYYGA